MHLQGISNPWLSLCLFNIVALDEQRQFDGKIGAEGWGRKLYLLRSTTPLLSGGSHNRNVNKLFIQWSPVKFWFLNSKYFPTFSSRRWHIFIFSVFSWNRMLHYSYNEKIILNFRFKILLTSDLKSFCLLWFSNLVRHLQPDIVKCSKESEKCPKE